MSPAVGPHMDIEQWLTALDLPQYAGLFDLQAGVEVCINGAHSFESIAGNRY